MPRKSFKKRLAARLLASLLPLAMTGVSPAEAKAQAEAPAQQRENIVFILIDDLRYDAMGFLTPELKTPNIDFLAKNGVYFKNAEVTSSLCSPSRATILTGESMRNHGIVDNVTSTEKGLTFFPQYLQKAGYDTAFFGKWHMGDNDDHPRPGFDHWVSFAGQGHYNPTTDLTPQEIAAGKRNMINVDGKEVAQKGYITSELTDYALDWLKDRKNKNKPFFLYLSHKAVHANPIPEPKYANEYADVKFKFPASMANTPANNEGKPMWVQNQRNSWHGVDFMYNGTVGLSDYVRQYWRTISSVDDSVGRVLKYLRDNHLDKNTMIIFMSDNGFQFGEHGLIDKRTAYEASLRVPLIAYAPNLLPKGQTRTGLVRNLDIAPTILDVAGVDRPAQFEGQSFIPLATGKTPEKQWKSEMTYEYYWNWDYPMTPSTFAIVRNGYKFIQYQGIWDIEELYDLKSDPDEMHNLAFDPRYHDMLMQDRHELFTSLTPAKGRQQIPFTERWGPGVRFRNLQGQPGASYPYQWLKPYNSPDAMDGTGPEKPNGLKPPARLGDSD